MCRKKKSFTGNERRGRKRRRRSVMKTTILWWLIDAGVVQENVQVYSRGKENEKTSRGRIKREGIECVCCNQVFSVAMFHVHGDGGRNYDRGNTYERIIIEGTNVSLMSCMIEAWNKDSESQCHKFNRIEPTSSSSGSDIHDDACMICGDGGELLCCEKCNSTHHSNCMGMKDTLEGSWYCPYCVCKFCGKPSPENDYLLKCPQCGRKYHWECHQSKEERIMDLNVTPTSPFCERSCKEVCDKLREMIVGGMKEIGGGFSWCLLHQIDGDFDPYTGDKYKSILCNSKLAVARRLMEECFDLIKDRYTRINVIQAVVYNCGSNFTRMNCEGFYTAVLEKDEEIISAASIRIHGTELADMPFIATKEEYRGQGMCRKLMDAIESALCFLKVENLIIPSVPEKIDNWIRRYGFRKLDISMQKEIMVHNTLTFHDSERLQKVIPSSSHFPISHSPSHLS